MAEDKKAQYRLHGMEVFNFFMQEITEDKIDLKNIKFGVTVEIKLNPEDKVIAIFVNVNLDKVENDSDKKLAEIKVVVGFEVKNFSEVILKDEEKGDYKIPYKLEAATRRIAISTTRGVLYTYLKGTYLHNAILPIVPELLKPEKKTTN